MCESHVSGCQLPACLAVKAQAIPWAVEAVGNVRVLVDVVVVVESDEAIPGGPAIHQHYRQQNKAADGPRRAAAWRAILRRFSLLGPTTHGWY